MADIKWIKLQTDIFNHHKIKQIETLPEGDAIIVIWLNILCLAGTSNRDGMIFFTDEIPYTEEMLVTEFRRSAKVVQLALMTFKKYGMIEVIDDIICISNWEKYQSTNKLAEIREQTRLRNINYRERKKLCDANSVMSTSRMTDDDATELELRTRTRTKNIDKEEGRADKPPKPPKKVKPVKHQYGQYKNVLLADEDLAKLKQEFPDYLQRIEKLSEYIESKGAKYQSHLATMRAWARKDGEREKISNTVDKVYESDANGWG